MLTAKTIGCQEFKKKHNTAYAYATGGMYRGVASKEMVARMASAGFLSFFGAGGLSLAKIQEAIDFIKENSPENSCFGINFLHNNLISSKDDDIIQLLLNNNVKNVEAAAFNGVTPALVWYKLAGLSKNGDEIVVKNRIMAKISRIPAARQFMEPTDENIIEELLKSNKITPEQAELGKHVPVADDICMESESAGHTDRRVALVMLPAVVMLRDEIQETYKYQDKICIGAAGGIGTAQAASAAFIMGADFILTGSINQCTVEAGTSDKVKDLLQKMDVEDTDFCPTGDMFEQGALIQVLKKGVLFPTRAKNARQLYDKYASIEEFSIEDREEFEKKYLGCAIDEALEKAKTIFKPDIIEEAKKDPKTKLGLILKMYFYNSLVYAAGGESKEKLNFQVHIGPALGGFNKSVKDTDLAMWKNRNVDTVAVTLLNQTANYLGKKINTIQNGFNN